MVTYLVGTDGVSASQEIGDFLDQEVEDGDHLEVINVLSKSVISGDDPEESIEGREALELFEERFGERVSVTTHQFGRGKKPTDEIIDHATEIDADRIVTALRRHSRTERIIFGSVSHSLLQRTTRPVILVPLPEYQAPVE
jgi:nucleotide-binding universal stress UspA family protein